MGVPIKARNDRVVWTKSIPVLVCFGDNNVYLEDVGICESCGVGPQRLRPQMGALGRR